MSDQYINFDGRIYPQKDWGGLFLDGKIIESRIEDIVLELFKLEDTDIDIRLAGDYYDWSLEIYFTNLDHEKFSISKEQGQKLLDLGFNIIFINFMDSNKVGLDGFEHRIEIHINSYHYDSKQGKCIDGMSVSKRMFKNGEWIFEKIV